MDEIRYRVIRSNRKTMSGTIKDGILEVRAPRYVSDEEIKDFVLSHRAWIEKHMAKYKEMEEKEKGEPGLTMDDVRTLADEALKVIPSKVKFYAEKLGVTYGRITVRNQTTKWGSCTAKGNLNFNCLLMLAPSGVLDSVIVHELAHRKHMNHSKQFYEEVLGVLPDYHKWDKWLKDNGGSLIRRMKRG